MNKKILFPILKHYFFLVLIPVGLAILFGFLGFQALPTVLIDFVIFFSPFIFFIVTYKKSAKTAESKWMLILFSFVFPYLIIYGLYIYAALLAISRLEIL
jgi:hypothetical protein